MGKFAKWVGLGLGFTFGGPIGALIGFAIGAYADSETGKMIKTGRKTSSQGDFAMSLLVLVAAVMKADGRVLKSELDYVKNYFWQIFDEETASEAIFMLRDILKKDIPVESVGSQIKQRMNYSSRLQLIHMIFGVIMADGVAHPYEINVAHRIADSMGINISDFNSIKAMFIKDNDSPYKILEIDKSASNDEVKKAYRKMAMKYHPDKLSSMDEEVIKDAENKFKKVSDAYEAIKKERNLN